MRNRDSIIDRYKNDSEFHHLVKTLEAQIYQHNFTPTEIRDALFLAQYLYHENNQTLYDDFVNRLSPYGDKFGGGK